MDYINSILGPQKGLLVEEAIPTLCNRLQHATMTSDRRSAVLGLKSFSRQYRELVVQYGLRGLVATLVKDSSQDAIVKAVLETLLVLFIRGQDDEDVTRGWISQQLRVQNGKYPSPILLEEGGLDQFLLMVADELTQQPDPENNPLKVIIDVVSEVEDFHIRLYALQLLELLVSTRPARTREALLAIPTAFSTIVSLLNDPHEPVRNEAILFLMAAVNRNFNIQKLVAFENTFDILFDIIDEEGGIRGSILVQDCLTLLTNLLMYNASNQKYFLETNCVARLAKLLGEPLADTDPDFAPPEDDQFVPPPMVWTEQRLQNMIIGLEICRTLVEDDRTGNNQDKLFECGILFVLLKLVFSQETVNQIRSVALLCTADLISTNQRLQLELSKVDVPYIDPSIPTSVEYDHAVAVPLALLNWALNLNSVNVFDVRVGAVCCLHEYFRDNNEAKTAFMKEQIELYFSETAITNGNGSAIPPPQSNLFTTLMDYDTDIRLNPYKIWFAAVLVLYLFEDCDENRQTARNVEVGNEGAGEEVMTSIQAMSSLLVTTLENTDIRISIGYMMLLSIWLVGDFQAVDDFLSDISTVRSLVAFVTNNSSELPIMNGMIMMLLGIAYEFSTKNSPTLRYDLYQLLLKAVGTTNYSLKVKQFEDDEAIKNFDENTIFNYQKDDTGLPEVYFDGIYVQMMKDNHLRFRRALFHDPEVQPKAKINYETYEELTRDFQELQKVVASTKEASETVKDELNLKLKELTSQYENTEKSLSTTTWELNKLKEAHKITEEKLKSLQEELSKTKAERDSLLASTKKFEKELHDTAKASESSNELVKSLTSKLAVAEEGRKKAEDGINKMNRELLNLTKLTKEAEKKAKTLENELNSLKKELSKKSDELEKGLKKLAQEKSSVEQQLEQLRKQMIELEKSHQVQLKEKDEKLVDTEASNEHLMDKLRSAGNAIQKMKAEMEKIEQKRKELDEQVAASKASVDAFLVTEEKYKTEISTLTKKTDEQTSEIESLKEEKKALDEKILNVENNLTKVKAENEILTEKSEEEKNKLKKQVEELEAKISSLKEDHESKSLSGVQEKELLTKELQVAKEQLKKLQKEVSTKESQVLEKSKELEEATKLSDSKATALQSEVDEMRKKLDEHESTLKTKEVELKEKTSQITEVQAKVEELESELLIAKTKLEEAEATSLKTTEELKETKSAENSARKQVAQLENEVKELKSKNADLAAEIEQLKEQKTALELHKTTSSEKHASSVAELEEAISKAKLQIKKNLDTLKKKDEEVSKSKAIAEKHVETISRHEKSIEDQKLKINELETRVSETNELKEKVRKELEQSASKLQELTDELSLSKNDFRTKLEAAERRAKELEVSLSDKEKEIEQDRALLSANSETAVKEYSEKVTKLEASISELKKQNHEKVKEVEDEAERQGQLVKELQKKLEGAEAKLKESSNENIKIDNLKNDFQKKLDTLNESFEEKDEQLKELKKEANQKTKQLSEIRAEHEGLKESAIESKNKLKSAEDEHGKTRTDLEAARKEVELLQEENEEFDEKVEELENEKTKLDAQISTLKEELAKVKESNNSAEGEKHALESTVSSLQERISNLETSLSTYEAKIAEVDENDEKILELEKEVHKLKEEFEKQREELEKQRDENSKQKDEIAKQKNEALKQIEKLSQENDALRADLGAKTEEHKVYYEDVKKAQKESLTLEQKVTQMTEEIRRLNLDLASSQETASEVARLETKMKSLEEENHKLELQRQSGEREMEKLNQYNDSLREDVVARELRPDAKQYVRKSEVDDLMLLMADMDEKIQGYKKLLKKHGEDVSSDESLSEEEEEEEDDDDEK